MADYTEETAASPGTPTDVSAHPTHNFSDRIRLAGDIKPLEPLGSIARAGQDTYRRETSRDSVTGSFRTQGEAQGLSITRTK